MPPTALAGIFAAQIVGMKDYTPVLRKAIIPALIIILYSIVMIIFSKELGSLIY